MTRTENVAEITYLDEESNVFFVWHGGAYIEVGPADSEPLDVINVWRDDVDESTLELAARVKGSRRPFRTVLEMFEDRCREYIEDMYAEDGEES